MISMILSRYLCFARGWDGVICKYCMIHGGATFLLIYSIFQLASKIHTYLGGLLEKSFMYTYPRLFQCLAIELLLFLSPAMRSW